MTLADFQRLCRRFEQAEPKSLVELTAVELRQLVAVSGVADPRLHRAARLAEREQADPPFIKRETALELARSCCRNHPDELQRIAEQERAASQARDERKEED